MLVRRPRVRYSMRSVMVLPLVLSLLGSGPVTISGHPQSTRLCNEAAFAQPAMRWHIGLKLYKQTQIG